MASVQYQVTKKLAFGYVHLQAREIYNDGHNSTESEGGFPFCQLGQPRQQTWRLEQLEPMTAWWHPKQTQLLDKQVSRPRLATSYHQRNNLGDWQSYTNPKSLVVPPGNLGDTAPQSRPQPMTA